MLKNPQVITRCLMDPIPIVPFHLRRLLWTGLCLEVTFLGLSLANFWAKFPVPTSAVLPSDDNFSLSVAAVRSEAPAFAILMLAVLLLIVVPGWIAALLLDECPDILSVSLFGLAALGGLVLGSQLLHIRSIWPALALHVAWQLVAWIILRRKSIAPAVLPAAWHLLALAVSMVLLGLFVLYFNPVLRLSFVDNGQYTLLTHRLDGAIGTMLGQARYDWNAWIALTTWIVRLTGIPPLYLYYQLWGIALTPLLALSAYAIVRRLSQRPTLALAAAWLTMLGLVTGANLPLPVPHTVDQFLTLIAAGSDKWVALALLTPAALTILVQRLDRPVSWSLPVVVLSAFGAAAAFHPQGLTALAWLLAAFVATDLVAGERKQVTHKGMMLLLCLVILFVLIPLVFPRSYSYTAAKNDTTEATSLGMGTYVRLSPGWFIVNPLLLVAPLTLGPVLLTLLGGLRRSAHVPGMLQRLLFSWTWAAVIFVLPPFASWLDRFWFPTWLDRFLWTLPFGVLAAVGLWRLAGRHRRVMWASLVALTVVLPAVSYLAPDQVDWRLAQEPVADQNAFDLVDYFRSQTADVSSVVLSELPGPQTLIYNELAYSRGIAPPNYGFPDIRKLYAAPWWGTTLLRRYVVNQVDWLIVERNSAVLPQIGLQSSRYRLVHENPVYLVYRVVKPFVLTPLDDLVDQLNTPDRPPADTLPRLVGDDAYSQTIVALAYQSLGQCDSALRLLEQAVIQSAFARVPYLQTLAACRQTDRLRSVASSWRDDPTLAGTLLSAAILRAVDGPTAEQALANWLARPNNQRNEGPEARTVADNLAVLRGRPDWAIRALRRLPDVLLDQADWYRLGYWAEQAGTPDPALDSRAGRDDLALLVQGHLSGEPHQARRFYQAAVDRAHSSTAYMFLAQTCEQLGDEACARAAYQAVSAIPNDPMAYYGTLALARLEQKLGEDWQPTDKLARAIAAGLSLSYVEGMPAPVVRPLSAGQALGDVLVSGRWLEPLAQPIPDHRLLEIGLAAPLPGGRAVYTVVGNGSGGQTRLNADLPADASIAWTLPLATGDIGVSTTLRALRQVSVFENGVLAFIADMPAWLPPETHLDGLDRRQPLAVFGDGLQLWEAAVTCTEQDQATLALTWRPTAPVRGRYTLTIHVADASGKLFSQIDERPFNDAYPTDSWLAGYAFQTMHQLHVPRPPFRLELGWYLVADGSRLPLQARTGADGTYSMSVDRCTGIL